MVLGSLSFRSRMSVQLQQEVLIVLELFSANTLLNLDYELLIDYLEAILDIIHDVHAQSL